MTQPAAQARHTHDAQYVAEIQRVTWGGLAANVVLAGFKIAGGLLGSSQAVVADAVHTLSDSGTDLAILIGVRFWSKPPDAGHPHGHRRIETMVTTAIALILAIVAAGLVYNALNTMHEHRTQPPGGIALAAALLSIGIKEAMYRWTAAVGRRHKSSALIANAWHHRSDALSSIPAAVAVGVATLKPGWAFVDHVGAVMVSLFVFHAAWKIGKPALGQLVDAGAPQADRERIERLVRSVPGVRDVESLRTRYVGSGLQVDLHLQVDGDLTVREGHAIAGRVKHHLIDHGPDVVDVVVHVEPYGEHTRPQGPAK
ncbi:MAG: cation transporter [Phycisphaerae bacterium]|nr:cation transporter [Phycisphaerae bacterium]